MKIKFFILFLSLFFAGISGAEPSNAETIKAIEVASKDFQVRIIEMHPPSAIIRLCETSILIPWELPKHPQK